MSAPAVTVSAVTRSSWPSVTLTVCGPGSTDTVSGVVPRWRSSMVTCAPAGRVWTVSDPLFGAAAALLHDSARMTPNVTAAVDTMAIANGIRALIRSRSGRTGGSPAAGTGVGDG